MAGPQRAGSTGCGCPTGSRRPWSRRTGIATTSWCGNSPRSTPTGSTPTTPRAHRRGRSGGTATSPRPATGSGSGSRPPAAASTGTGRPGRPPGPAKTADETGPEVVIVDRDADFLQFVLEDVAARRRIEEQVRSRLVALHNQPAPHRVVHSQSNPAGASRTAGMTVDGDATPNGRTRHVARPRGHPRRGPLLPRRSGRSRPDRRGVLGLRAGPHRAGLGPRRRHARPGHRRHHRRPRHRDGVSPSSAVQQLADYGVDALHIELVLASLADARALDEP